MASPHHRYYRYPCIYIYPDTGGPRPGQVTSPGAWHGDTEAGSCQSRPGQWSQASITLGRGEGASFPLLGQLQSSSHPSNARVRSLVVHQPQGPIKGETKQSIKQPMITNNQSSPLQKKAFGHVCKHNTMI